MRQSHPAGECLFVDYAGQTFDVIDPRSGEIHPAQIFAAVLGASNYTALIIWPTMACYAVSEAHMPGLAARNRSAIQPMLPMRWWPIGGGPISSWQSTTDFFQISAYNQQSSRRGKLLVLLLE
jgi:hypothetical protein